MLLRLGEKLVYRLFAILAGYMFLASIFGTCVMVYTDEHTFYLKDYAIVICVGLAVFLFLLIRFSQKITEFLMSGMGKRVLFFLTAIWLFLLMAIIINTNLPMVYDQGKVLAGADSFLKGDYTQWTDYNYFYAYPYLNGMVLMEMPFVALFGEQAVLAMQFCNIFFWYVTICFLTKMSEEFFGKKAGVWTYLALLGFIPMWFYMTFVYGTIPGLCMGVAAFYCQMRYDRSEKTGWALGSILLMFFSVAWKSNYQIFLIALLCGYIVQALQKKKMQPVLYAGLALILLLTELSLINAVMHRITGESVKGGTPTITWVAMGLQESSIAPGWYNSYTELMYETHNYEAEPIIQASKESIAERLTLFREEPDYGLLFFFRKIASMWNNPAFQCFTIVTKRNVNGSLSYGMKDLLYDGGKGNIVLRVMMDVLHSMTLFGMVLHVIFEKKKRSLKEAVLIITFLGGFLFHLVWEAMGQYALPYYLLLFPYAVNGYARAVRTFQEKGKEIIRAKEGGILIALGLLIIGLSFAAFPPFTSTIRLQGGESDYIWYCRNQTEWKNDEYYKR